MCAPLYRSGTDVCMCARGPLEVNLLADNLRADRPLCGSEVGEGSLGPSSQARSLLWPFYSLRLRMRKAGRNHSQIISKVCGGQLNVKLLFEECEMAASTFQKYF